MRLSHVLFRVLVVALIFVWADIIRPYNAFAVKTRNLHYGEKSEPLFSDRKSTPALIVQIEEVLHYGYLTPGVVSGKLIIEKSPGERYSLTVPPSCAPGTYSDDSYIPCQPCGIGHYCTGGSNRQACTWEARGCPGANYSIDDMPPLNGYVTSGLIVHLDAIKNTAAGHNPSATTWSDLSGNNNDFMLFNSPTIGIWGIVFNGINQYARSSNILNLGSHNAITIEVNYRKTIVENNFVHMFELTDNYNNVIGGIGISLDVESVAIVPNVVHTVHDILVSATGANNYNISIDNLAGHTITNTFSTVPNPTGRLFYFDGQQISASGLFTTGPSIYGNIVNDHFYILSRGGTTHFSKAMIHSLRIYNRQLSPAEVCQNAWADYNRFGGAAPGC